MFKPNVGNTLRGTLSVPRNIVMDMNNVMSEVEDPFTLPKKKLCKLFHDISYEKLYKNVIPTYF
jgi:hypothetical protein